MTRLFTARVHNGVLVPEGVTLPEGTVVTVAVNDEVAVEAELTTAEATMLDAAIAEADAEDGDGISTEEVLARLDRQIAAKR